MKKIIALFTVFAFAFNMVIAQEAGKSKAAEGKKEAKTEKAQKSDKEAVKAPKEADAKAASTGEPKTKKDGTPDMRYKENKDAKKEAPAGPLKKDGTPDKRYKENKDSKEKDAKK